MKEGKLIVPPLKLRGKKRTGTAALVPVIGCLSLVVFATVFVGDLSILKVHRRKTSTKWEYPFQNRHLKSIPRIIHHTWKSHVPPKWAAPAMISWAEINPSWGTRLWDDSEVADIVSRQMPEAFMTSVWPHLPPIQRTNVFKYAVVYELGGVYADLDVRCVIPVDTWAAGHFTNVDFIAGFERVNVHREPGFLRRWHTVDEFQIAQWTFAAAPGHWLLREVLDAIVAHFDGMTAMRAGGKTIAGWFNNSLASTGPGIWSKTIRAALEKRIPGVQFDEVPLNRFALRDRGAHIGSVLLLPRAAFGLNEDEAAKLRMTSSRRRGAGPSGSDGEPAVVHGFQKITDLASDSSKNGKKKRKSAAPKKHLVKSSILSVKAVGAGTQYNVAAEAQTATAATQAADVNLAAVVKNAATEKRTDPIATAGAGEWGAEKKRGADAKAVAHDIDHPRARK